MKNILLGLLLVCFSKAYAGELNTFNDIRNTILNGNNIKLTIDFNACTPKINDLVIYTVPHDIALHKTYLEFADIPYITDISAHEHTGVDIENVTYKLTDADELHFQFKSIMLTGGQTTVHESDAVCSLHTAVRVFN